MQQLVESIKRNGVMTPATVRLKEDGRYELVESETSNQNEPVSQGKNQVSETKPAVTESLSLIHI